VLPPQVAHQVRHVLRLGEGDTICLLDNSGWAYYARLQTPHAHSVPFELVGREQLATEPPFAVVVLQSLLRAEKAEQVVRLCTAAGAHAIWFAPSERSVVEWSEPKRQARQERWQTIAREEAELACRAHCPQVAILPDWWSALQQLPAPRLLLDEWEGVQPITLYRFAAPDSPSPLWGEGRGGGSKPLEGEAPAEPKTPSPLWSKGQGEGSKPLEGEAPAEPKTPSPLWSKGLGKESNLTAVSLIVGPEGGFAPHERERMTQQYACIPISLGARVLRAEIAAFYAIAQLDALFTARPQHGDDHNPEPAP
jgi:16S rRNA U1498 N3-methylase RsmE